jgi:alkylated DNA repair protein (DNA oxidative demethylase)
MTNIDATSEAAPVKEITMAEIMPLDLDLLRLDEEIQTRKVRESESLDLLRELYRDDPQELPPLVVFRDEEGVNWLADGHYRYRAACDVLDAAGPRAIRAEVHRGTKRDAILYAAGANKHGQSLTSAEKRRVVERLLNDPEWLQWSDREIARHTGTSNGFVSGIRQKLEMETLSVHDEQIAAPTRLVQRGDTMYQMNTANIGHPASAPATFFPLDVEEPADGGEGMEVVITKGLDRLKNAWKAASPPARRTFREWVVTQPLEDLAVVASSGKAKRFSAVIADVCLPAGQEAAPPEGFVYVPDFLNPIEQDSLLHELRALTYTHDKMRENIFKRGWAQFGYAYVSTGRKLTPAPPMPRYLKTVIDKAAPYYPPGIEFAQCIVTQYPENAGIGWHTDAPPFGDCILGVSLASEARLQFRPKGETKAAFEVTASPGSVYIIQGVARWHYQHRLVPVKEERYSLTFRTIA